MYKKVINSQKEMLAWSWVLHYLHYLHGPPVEEAGPTCVLLPWLRSPWNAKKLFRFHEETYHFALFMMGLRLESLNGIKPCISTNPCMGKEPHFILIKQYHFIQKKICNSSASHCYFGLKSNFLFAILTQSSTILHFEARVTWWLCCFLQLSL